MHCGIPVKSSGISILNYPGYVYTPAGPGTNNWLTVIVNVTPV